MVDEIYKENREAVDDEIQQVEDPFLKQAVKDDKSGYDIELINLIKEKEIIE